MSSVTSTFHHQDGDSCRWITAGEFREIEDGICERGFPTEMELHAVYIDIRDALDYGNVDFAVAGGYAMNAYGIRRQTGDVDFYFNATDDQIFTALRALPTVSIKAGLGTSTAQFRIHFLLSTGVFVGVDFRRVPFCISAIDLKLSSNKNVVLLDDRETRTLKPVQLVNAKLGALHSRRKADLPTWRDEEDIYRLIIGLISVEEAHLLNRDIIVKELLLSSSLNRDQKQSLRDLICPDAP
ncbi:hypothetical protein NP233_g1259 [Leucocoprinus birnbaumii]|uniref:Uncharacterized protein n=1 Tax=Leucocoprinus birnbaumii TaxID=56174 RepID=A0AAD5W4E3_9AGAR|nr:hypothetical protein NP233_g1259 [Leucocoprinus birnbaumii]